MYSGWNKGDGCQEDKKRKAEIALCGVSLGGDRWKQVTSSATPPQPPATAAKETIFSAKTKEVVCLSMISREKSLLFSYWN